MPARDETWQVVMPADDLWEGELTGIRLGAKNCQLAVFGTRVRAGQIEILAPGPE